MQNSADDREYLTTYRAGRVLGVTAQTVRRWIRAGALRAKRHGRNYLVPRQAIDNFIASLPDARTERHTSA